MPESESPPPVSRRSWLSLLVVLFVQTQNAFNDNFVKFVLIGLGGAVAQGVVVFSFDMGDKIQYLLAALIPIPFILGAPVSGWVSDRFSKRSVIISCLFLQLALFALILMSIIQKQVYLAIIGYFLLAVQSTLFSPAKQGILKELVGSSRLALANGLMSMLAMIGILGGIGLGGAWFDHILQGLTETAGVSTENAWEAAQRPTMWIGLGCLVPIGLAYFIQRTPSHPEKKFEAGIWVRHFRHLGMLLKDSTLRGIALNVALYWFIANSIALIFLSFGRELFPNIQEGGATKASSDMMICVGIGLFAGSTVVSILSRSRIRANLIPLGAMGIALGLVGIVLFDPSGLAFKGCIGVVGFASGFFAVPLAAMLQDRAHEDERGRVISASNLLNSVSGVLSIALFNRLDSAGLSASAQMVVVLVAATAVAVWTLPYLRGEKEAVVSE